MSCLPVRSSASNSALILPSKSNNDFWTPSISFKEAPNSLAATAALASAPGLADKLACKPLEDSPMSPNISLTEAVVLLVCNIALVLSNILDAIVSVSLPCNLNNVVKLAALLPAKPNLSVKLRKVSDDCEVTSKNTPASCFNLKNES